MQPSRTALNCLHNHPLWDPPTKCRVAPSPLDTQTAPCDTWHRSFHPDGNSPSFYPDISHPKFCPPTFHPSGYLTSGILSADIPSTRISHIRNPVRPTFHLLRISHTRRLSPDGRGRRFNFPGQTCPDPSVTLIRRTSVANDSHSPDSLHPAPGVWTTKPPGFPCFSPRLSWVQGLPMRPISPGLNQVAKGLTTIQYCFLVSK